MFNWPKHLKRLERVRDQAVESISIMTGISKDYVCIRMSDHLLNADSIRASIAARIKEGREVDTKKFDEVVSDHTGCAGSNGCGNLHESSDDDEFEPIDAATMFVTHSVLLNRALFSSRR